MFLGMDHLNFIQTITVWALPVLFAVTVHEVAHGFVANYLGDKTAFIMGRLSLNPLKHIDLIGTIIVPILLLLLGGFIFGWAKPVPVTMRNLRKPRRDMMLVAAAGPLANILMAIAWAFIAKFGILLSQYGYEWALAILYMGSAGIMINSVLAVLNLLPIPPLDGGHILMGFLPSRLSMRLHRLEPYGFFVLLFLLAFGLLNHIINPLVAILETLVSSL